MNVTHELLGVITDWEEQKTFDDVSAKTLNRVYKDVYSLEQENKDLRRLLAIYTGGPYLYLDDGELQSNSVRPFIDFKRDTPELIKQKLFERRENAVSKLHSGKS